MKGGEPILIDNKAKIGILMLHGFTSTPNQFKEAAEFFSKKGYTVSAPLIAGHGTTPEDLMNTTRKQWEDSVKKAYLELREKVEKVVLLGNSFGGNLAMWLAKEFNNEQFGFVSLGTPIYLKYQLIIKLRYYLYGWMKKYYKKPKRNYKIDYIDLIDQITYPVIPIKSLKRFLDYLKKETIPNLKKITLPSFIIHADKDDVVNSKSAAYIYRHIRSDHRMIYFFKSDDHAIFDDKLREDILEKIYNFLQTLS